MNLFFRLGTVILIIILAVLMPACTGCNSSKDTSEVVSEKLIKNEYPAFKEDSAYAYIQKQLAFGYRIPGTAAHKLCADWLFSLLKKYCDTVYYQKGTAITFDKKTIPVYNLIGSFNPKNKQRGMFASHWDSRPWGDNDTAGKDSPIPAANDGASGVGVLLELASNLKKNRPVLGVDIVFFDAEDYGKSEFENSFCLGSQYWGKNPHIAGYRAQFGVLLDMVGGKNAHFMGEGGSMEWGKWIVEHTWGLAAELGYGSIFINQPMGGSITDDHVYVYQATRTPMIDIIQYESNGHFAPYWHTHNDNMESIDKNTLKAVGETMTALVFNPPMNFAN